MATHQTKVSAGHPSGTSGAGRGSGCCSELRSGKGRTDHSSLPSSLAHTHKGHYLTEAPCALYSCFSTGDGCHCDYRWRLNGLG